MEAILLLADIIGLLLLLYWSITNDKRGPDAPTTGLFAYRETAGGSDRGDATRGTPRPRPRRRL